MKLIIANWKCNPSSLKEVKKLFNSLRKGLKKNNFDIVICPPFVYLDWVKQQNSKIKLGTQNFFWENPPAGKGAFSGEVSAIMLKDLGVEYAILGHSERRKFFKETDEMVNKKIKIALSSDIKPIFCLGESKEEKERGKNLQILKNQLKEGLRDVSHSDIKKIIIAYEPIWAIGTGKPASIEDVSSSILYIRKIISEVFNKKTGKDIKILYGGSINSKNAESYLNQPWIDGLLVGGASLDPKEFLGILKK